MFFNKNPFKSFWMGGFECADMLTNSGKRIDLLHVTGHLQHIQKDYQLLNFFNIKTVREGIRWSVVEKQPYVYDWSDVITMMHAGKQQNIQQVWDMCHFGYPDDLTPFHPQFANRFAALCQSFVQLFRSVDPDSELIITPVNEVGFISWLGGEVGGTNPYCVESGWQVKYQLVKAYIKAIEAIKEIDPSVRILITEPLVNMVAAAGATDIEIAYANHINELQFQVADMLSGRICAELNGRPEYVDMIGCNYYYNNQWIVNEGNFLCWKNEDKDIRWKSLGTLLHNVYERYQCPLVLSETSHPKEDRPLWIDFIGNECRKIMEANIPLWGICWYPVIDRPEMDDNLHPWHQAGLWDVPDRDNLSDRVLHIPSAEALKKQQLLFNNFSASYAMPKQHSISS